MKYAKMLGLLAIAVAALASFAATASATTLTSPLGTTYTGKIVATSQGHAVLHANGISTVECHSTIEGNVEQHGVGKTVKGKITKLTFEKCTGNNTVTSVPKTGELELHYTSGFNGTLTALNQEVVVFNHSFGGTCIYTTSATGTHIGDLTGGKTAILHTTSGGAIINRTGGTLGIFCGSTGTWTATYEVTTPDELYVDP